MHLVGVLGVAPQQLVSEDLRKQLVIAVRLAAVVERDQEEIRALELHEQLSGALPLYGRVAKRPVH